MDIGRTPNKKSYVYAGLSNVNEKAFLTYHQGRAAVGTDYTIVLREDGTNEIFLYGYLCQKSFGDTMVQVVQFPPPSSNNIFIKRKGKSEFSNIGDPNYRYGSELFMPGSEKSLNPGGRVSEIVPSRQFVACIFEKGIKTEYKMMVF